MLAAVPGDALDPAAAARAQAGDAAPHRDAGAAQPGDQAEPFAAAARPPGHSAAELAGRGVVIGGAAWFRGSPAGGAPARASCSASEIEQRPLPGQHGAAFGHETGRSSAGSARRRRSSRPAGSSRGSAPAARCAPVASRMRRAGDVSLRRCWRAATARRRGSMCQTVVAGRYCRAAGAEGAASGGPAR